MTQLKVAAICVIILITMSTLGVAAFYSDIFKPVDVSTDLSDSMATLTEDDIIVDASIDYVGSNEVDINQIDMPISTQTDTISLDEAKSNNIVVDEKKSTSVTINDPIDSTKKLVYGGTSPQRKTVATVNENCTSNNENCTSNNENCTPNNNENCTPNNNENCMPHSHENCTPDPNCKPNPNYIQNLNSNNMIIINNADFIRPTYAQLLAFLTNDNTDTLGLNDNSSVVQLAKNACQNKIHNEIVVLVFGNGQVYAVNRFALNDGTFAYVDCSKVTGLSNSGTQYLDRILNVHRNMPVTATNPYQTNVVYTYPTINLMYGIPMWSI